MDTANPYEGRRAHWIKHNETERFPHRWIVADTEGKSEFKSGVEIQTLRCVDAVRWRDDLKTGEHEEWHAGESAPDFWAWVDEYTRAGHRTVLWYHNVSYDLRTLDAFRILPQLGWTLEWCNLSRDVSVVSWRSDHGTLVIADTYTWCPKPLVDLSGMVAIGKPKLPSGKASLATWHARCKADVEITRAVVKELLAFVKGHHLGNWQPSGAGMGYAAWRHRFLSHKVLVHDDALALAAEREAMHTGRAEAWWHGKASMGPFTEWDMAMSYPRIAAECDVPVKLFAHDAKVTPAIHKWAMKHWTVLARVRVRTDQPVVPCRHDGRIIWPVGEFETTLWQPELELITHTGGSYEVLEQWRYNVAPVLRDWATWSIEMLERPDTVISPIAKTFVKHQARAVIGRFGLMHSTWEDWGANPYNWCGVTDYLDGETGETARMLHVGDKTMMETARKEADSSLPQITGYIMSEARVRLWCATEIADPDHVLHVDTDGIIVDRAGNANMEAFAAVQLRGNWRQKERWAQLTVNGPRHFTASGKREIPGVPKSATEVEPGKFEGQVWQSLSGALAAGNASSVRITDRTWRPKVFDGRRPWGDAGVAQPIRLDLESGERAHEDQGNPEAGKDTPPGRASNAKGDPRRQGTDRGASQGGRRSDAVALAAAGRHRKRTVGADHPRNNPASVAGRSTRADQSDRPVAAGRTVSDREQHRPRSRAS